jgi:putative colanic acid biosynthesis acetyltransferase WcaF
MGDRGFAGGLGDEGTLVSSGAQDLARFRLPEGFRGRPAWFCQLWWIVQATLFGCTPLALHAWRVSLLRLFGARIGRGVRIEPSVRVIYPWRLSIGDHVWIGDDVVLYTLAPITIGSHVVISQRGYLCAGGHDMTRPTFDTTTAPITVEDEVWLALDVTVLPGVTVRRGSVVGARSTVVEDTRPGWLHLGSPARAVRPRAADAGTLSASA